jgi:hypothetical protein
VSGFDLEGDVLLLTGAAGGVGEGGRQSARHLVVAGGALISDRN